MGDRAGSSPVIRMMIRFSGMEKWMEMVENCMESGFSESDFFGGPDFLL